MRTKTYLGDGVYAELDWRTSDLILTTENGAEITNQIVLEPEVFLSLMKFAQEQLGIDLSPSLRK